MLAQSRESLPPVDGHGLGDVTRLVLQELERRLREGDGPEACGPFMYTRYGKTVIEQI